MTADGDLQLHKDMMQRALFLAQAQAGLTGKNPNIGCVIAKDKTILAEAATSTGGRPHAEYSALQNLSPQQTDGAAAYVTLEPCAHHGETPSCAKLLMAANITQIYIACLDPDPRTSGQGVEIFVDAGIAVHIGLCEARARKQLKPFLDRFEN